jgi:hypothetical protein
MVRALRLGELNVLGSDGSQTVCAAAAAVHAEPHSAGPGTLAVRSRLAMGGRRLAGRSARRRGRRASGRAAAWLGARAEARACRWSWRPRSWAIAAGRAAVPGYRTRHGAAPGLDAARMRGSGFSRLPSSASWFQSNVCTSGARLPRQADLLTGSSTFVALHLSLTWRQVSQP